MFDNYPLIVAANRDEHYDRPSQPPILPSRKPKILAGRDLRAGGTWLGVNEYGLLVGILNRRSNAEDVSRPTTRSRGLLCVDLLGLETAARAREFLQAHQESYNPFTVLCADINQAELAYNAEERMVVRRLAKGLHVFSSGMVDFTARSEKVNRAYDRFAEFTDTRLETASSKNTWVTELQQILGDHTLGNGSSDPRDALCVHAEISGTVSSSIIRYSQHERRFETFFCAGAPCQNAFGESLSLDVP